MGSSVMPETPETPTARSKLEKPKQKGLQVADPKAHHMMASLAA